MLLKVGFLVLILEYDGGWSDIQPRIAALLVTRIDCGINSEIGPTQFEA